MARFSASCITPCVDDVLDHNTVPLRVDDINTFVDLSPTAHFVSVTGLSVTRLTPTATVPSEPPDGHKFTPLLHPHWTLLTQPTCHPHLVTSERGEDSNKDQCDILVVEENEVPIVTGTSGVSIASMTIDRIDTFGVRGLLREQACHEALASSENCGICLVTDPFSVTPGAPIVHGCRMTVSTCDFDQHRSVLDPVGRTGMPVFC